MQALEPDARPAIFGWAQDLYDNAVDRKDAAGFAATFTDDGWLQFGNNERIHGPAAIESAIAQFFTAMVSLRHEARGAYLDGDTLFLEAVVNYVRHDGGEVAVNAMTVFRLASVDGPDGPKADQCRIFVDLAPLFGPGA